MIKPILNALIEVLKFKQYTTIAELSRLAGKKQLEVLAVLNKNSRFYRQDPKNKSKIIGWSQWLSEEVNKVYQSGKTYRPQLINYGAATELETKNKNADKFRETYYCGGFGDSYAVKVILDNPENRTKLEELGIILQELYEFPTIYQLWVE